VSDDQDPGAMARAVMDANRYITLGTADERGHPWVSPVWCARAKDGELFWVSSAHARHSRNLAARPQVSIVVFDSQAPARHRLYRAAVTEHWVLGPGDERLPVAPATGSRVGA
jgi:nitroimidazol reductase NimA-like FMN-containing flavoprotein (pyridoxamine 5'-phosphate oxidase superfamily)